MFKLLVTYSIFLIYFTLNSENIFASQNCSSFWRIGFPDPAHIHDEINCTEAISPLPMSAQIYYVDTLETNPDLLRMVNAVSDSLVNSITYYHSFGELPPIKVILYDRPYFDDRGSDTTYAFAFINFYQPREACPVLIYPSAFTFPEEKFKQIVAHELFHCFQMENMHDIAAYGTHHDNVAWWLEGSAQFMSNLVYPSADLEYMPMFGHYSANDPLTTQIEKYMTVNFFQSVYNSTGRNASTIMNIIRAMPTVDGVSQESALMSIDQMNDKFHDFAKDMVLGRLLDSSGRMAPTSHINRINQEVTLEDHQQINLVVMPYTIMPYRLRLPNKGIYHLEIQADNLNEVKASIVKVNEHNWQSLPTSITSDCGEDSEYDLIITKVGNDLGMSEISLNITRNENESCGCEVTSRPTHSCLFGEWELDLGSMEAFIRRMLPHDNNVQFLGSSGGVHIRMDRNGNINGEEDNLIMNFKITDRRGNSMFLKQVSNGPTHGRYTNLGRNKICADQGVSERTCTMYITTPRGTNSTNCATVGAGFSRALTYECSGDTFIFRTAIGLGAGGSDLQVDYIYHRVSH